MERMHPTEKDQFCEYIYNEHIVSSYNYLKDYAGLTAVKLVIPISCYTNFRDAMFHFRKMVISYERQQIEEQAFAIKEHLSRAQTDANNIIVFWLATVFEQFLADDKYSETEKKQFREQMHKLKKIILIKRMNGMMLSSDDILKITQDAISQSIHECFRFFSDSYPLDFAEKLKGYNLSGQQREEQANMPNVE